MGSNSSNNSNTKEVPGENRDTRKGIPQEDSEEIDDPVELMLKKTGCLEKHYGVQECIAETRDWRQCQKQVSEFRSCMEEHQKREKLSIQK